ncbi:hypothetical protein GG344DRAFT_83611 [Lentinula edodes]|nr:hypothetical protein GG344DRAFT_83611 [Lentinula edodes]
MPRIKFNKEDHRILLPNDAGQAVVVDLTIYKTPELRRLCKKYELGNIKQSSNNYLTALRLYSSNPSTWRKQTELNIQEYAEGKNQLISKKQSKFSNSASNSQTYRSLQQLAAGVIDPGLIQAWLVSVHSKILHTPGFPLFSISTSPLGPQVSIEAKHAPPLQSLSDLKQISIGGAIASVNESPADKFCETYKVLLARGTYISFTENDISKYPTVAMPHSSEQYIQKLVELKFH